MTTEIIFHIAEALLVGVILAFINKGSGKASYPDIQGRYHLTMNRAYFYVGYGSVILGSLFAFAPFHVDEPDLFFVCTMFCVFALFFLLGVICIKYYKNHYLIFDKQGIEVQSFRKVTSFASWSEISGVRFHSLSGNFVLSLSNTKDKIRINHHLAGLSTFLVQLREKTGINVAGPGDALK